MALSSVLAASLSLSASGCDNSPGAKPGASAATTDPAPAAGLVAAKRSMEECTFELLAPEALQEKTTDAVSFTLEGSSFMFQGFVGQSLRSEPTHPLDDMLKGGQFVEVYRGKQGTQLLTVLKAGDKAPKGDPKSVVTGYGSEPYQSGVALGCSFLCGGPASREADVVAMCKSVKITVDQAKRSAQ
jgi:hypothetical protein